MSIFGWRARDSRSVAAKTSPTRRPAAQPTSESGWQSLRGQPRHCDLVLSPLAKTWCDSLHPRHRPTQLCALYPRLANRLALCWDDAALAARVLDNLVVDKRRNRAGFPPEVSQELIHLRLLRPSRPGTSDFAPMWDASGMASCDR